LRAGSWQMSAMQLQQEKMVEEEEDELVIHHVVILVNEIDHVNY
jgi:hypothetical protein